MGNRIDISKDRTYPVVGTYCIRPTIRHRRWRIQIHFLNPRTYPVGELHRYFEGSHVPDCRGVLHTPHRRPRRRRKRDSFRIRWWCLVRRMQYAPTLSADKDSMNRHAFGLKGQICSCDGSTLVYRTGVVSYYNGLNKSLLSFPRDSTMQAQFRLQGSIQ